MQRGNAKKGRQRDKQNMVLQNERMGAGKRLYKMHKQILLRGMRVVESG